ncbi:MAG: LL-diaminopimelate aminotransferase [Clostridia bacterium]|nr:LL-diaminopimelate aminotransferase [Clostridia bacterium]
MKFNENFLKLEENYIFNDLKLQIQELENSDTEIIDLGIGDVKLPLFPLVTSAMKKACDELSEKKTFLGYPPSQGYLFLREKIARNYLDEGACVDADEIFITDGAKGQLGNVLELFSNNLKVLFLSPCYPAGAEANILLGNKVTFLSGNKENSFIPNPPFDKSFDLIYICSPNNPTGSAFSHNDLKIWINYALSTGAIIIYDGAYSAFLPDGYPKTVYAIKGAKNCAIETRSFSKSLGFTGVRCGFTVVPKDLGDCNKLWKRRLGCRFNGVSYPTQRGAEAIFCKEGKAEVKKRINFYKTNAEILKIALKNKNLWYNNTVSSPYVFAKVPNAETSRDFCKKMLAKIRVVATPGSGFLQGGEGYFRLSAFETRKKILEAADRILTL